MSRTTVRWKGTLHVLQLDLFVCLFVRSDLFENNFNKLNFYLIIIENKPVKELTDLDSSANHHLRSQDRPHLELDSSTWFVVVPSAL